jgi:hypothetical protein
MISLKIFITHLHVVFARALEMPVIRLGLAVASAASEEAEMVKRKEFVSLAVSERKAFELEC